MEGEEMSGFDKVLGTLQQAIEIEKYGYNFYTSMRPMVKDNEGQKLIAYLGKLEVEHIDWLEDEYRRQLAKMDGLEEGVEVSISLMAKEEIFLSDEGLVQHEKYGYVELTAEGEEIAKETIRRHKALKCFFNQALGIDEKTAEEDACKIEHVISVASMERLVKFLEFMEACPLGEANFPQRYRYFLEHGKLPEECLQKDLRKRK